MIFKRSQAALEFLTTYGWAFLIILIMIGALAYFGILKPSRLLPNRCIVGAEFQCLDYQIKATDVKLRLKNNVGEAIDVTILSITDESANPLTCTSPSPLPLSWKAGEIEDITFTSCANGALIDGEKAKVLFTMRYNTVTSGPDYAREVKGEVYATVIV